jgi:FkbM family methyltransferase
MSRLGRLLAKSDFRRHPVRAVYRRLYWRWHWRFRAGNPFVVPFFGGLALRLAPSSASLGVYLNDGFSDEGTARLFLDYLRPGMVALDCGAHIGEYTALFASVVGPDGEVHAFEPDPRVFRILLENIRRNGLGNVRAWQKALGEMEGVARFRLATDATRSALAPLAPDADGETVEVAVTTLDAYVEDVGLKRVDALKVDVEGAEDLLLTGAGRLLSDLCPGLIVIECHREPAPIVHRLENCGYRVSVRQDNLHVFPHILARRERMA